ncbi:MAG: hypothetical protein K6F63_04620 [Lachnospiraceae bacterium]|nr:hypothetical protein [Lachnospiraceae bacterium]
MTQTVSLYDAAYTEGYNAALREMGRTKRSASHIKEYKPEESKQAKNERLSYLLKQKFAGVVLLAASVAGLVATEGDFAVALFTIPLGALILLTNKRIFK